MAFRAAPPFVHLEGFSKAYGSGPCTVRVLDQLDPRHGRDQSLLVRSRAGKSTFLGLIAGLMLPDEGRISIGG